MKKRKKVWRTGRVKEKRTGVYKETERERRGK